MENQSKQQCNFKSFFLTVITVDTLFVTTYSPTVEAASKGDWFMRFGVAQVSPNDSSGTLSGAPTVGVAVDSNTQLFANISYMYDHNIAFELLAATPFEHKLFGTGAVTTQIATVKQLPPTFSVQYHFSPKESINPYLGVGINYTIFFDEKVVGTITSISLDDSLGYAAQAWVDFKFNEGWFANIDMRYINIETTATTNLGTVDVKINPWVLSAGVGFSF
ncbi:MAG: outer membrane protein OmpW [Gammaproteobacteria bacterium]|nr:MAG: outer membrane protein OmpW [Gammaproteobacteria bacterium]